MEEVFELLSSSTKGFHEKRVCIFVGSIFLQRFVGLNYDLRIALARREDRGANTVKSVICTVFSLMVEQESKWTVISSKRWTRAPAKHNRNETSLRFGGFLL